MSVIRKMPLPNTQGLCCWHCTEPFEGKAFSYPVRREGERWFVKGIFCGLPCRTRYVIDSPFLNAGVLTLCNLMDRRVYGVKHVQPAAPREMLKKFFPWPGGLSLDELRNPQKKYSIVEPPCFPFLETFVCEEDPDESVQQEDYKILKHFTKDTSVDNSEETVETVPSSQFPSRKLTTLDSFFDACEE